MTERTQAQTQLGKQKFIKVQDYVQVTDGDPGLWGGKGKGIHIHESSVVPGPLFSPLGHAP